MAVCGEKCIIPAKQPNPSRRLVGCRSAEAKTGHCQTGPCFGPNTGVIDHCAPESAPESSCQWHRSMHPWLITTYSALSIHRIVADAERRSRDTDSALDTHGTHRCRNAAPTIPASIAQPQRHPAPWPRRRPPFDSAPPHGLGATLAGLASLASTPLTGPPHDATRAVTPSCAH